ncbi:GtrA family protein [Methylobacterium isbiliense]|uniref:GtrA family protein n=1 Tax=Methylobacterium isbiliense TaxID=315478 RepID=UPI0027960FAC|nr:GtrA family protein [Methylobacterium isbiliense]
MTDRTIGLAARSRHPLVALAGQFTAYLGVGLVAMVAHYGTLVALVEVGRLDPVAASVIGYACGGVVSYTLNRRHTFASDRPHAQAVWRFALVAGLGLVLTGLLMALLTRGLGLPYLAAQVLTTGIVLFWNFSGNRIWTFAVRR